MLCIKRVNGSYFSAICRLCLLINLRSISLFGQATRSKANFFFHLFYSLFIWLIFMCSVFLFWVFMRVVSSNHMIVSNGFLLPLFEVLNMLQLIAIILTPPKIVSSFWVLPSILVLFVTLSGFVGMLYMFSLHVYMNGFNMHQLL